MFRIEEKREVGKGYGTLFFAPWAMRTSTTEPSLLDGLITPSCSETADGHKQSPVVASGHAREDETEYESGDSNAYLREEQSLALLVRPQDVRDTDLGPSGNKVSVEENLMASFPYSLLTIGSPLYRGSDPMLGSLGALEPRLPSDSGVATPPYTWEVPMRHITEDGLPTDSTKSCVLVEKLLTDQAPPWYHPCTWSSPSPWEERLLHNHFNLRGRVSEQTTGPQKTITKSSASRPHQ